MIPKLKDIEEKMGKSIEATQRNFMSVRTGRATPHILDGIKVECYGTLMTINQVANIIIPEPKLIEIKPWDKNVLSDIEKAINKSELGLNAINDGKVIRIGIPPLTSERRTELTKVVRKMAEDGRIAVRGIRREENEILDKAKAAKEISEDENKRLKEQIQRITDHNIAQIDKLLANKEKEIMEI